MRPLLPFPRAELRVWLEREGVPWREDETNENERFARNRVRHRVLPALERRMPGATERLARAGEALSARLDALDRRLEEKMGEEKISLNGNCAAELLHAAFGRRGGSLSSFERAAASAGRLPPHPPGRKQIEKVLLRLRRDPVFHESFAGNKLTATPRFVRLSLSKKKTTETA